MNVIIPDKISSALTFVSIGSTRSKEIRKQLITCLKKKHILNL